MNNFYSDYLSDAIRSFRDYKKLAERAMTQVSDGEFFAVIDDEANSIAVIVKHIAGNLRSRWRDFLTSDGEKADRDRDSEFEITEDGREALMEFWETGWKTLFDNIEPLTEGDFSRTITIRGEPHTVVGAINRQLTHYAYHIGQIVFLAKHLKSDQWKNLSVPRNRSAAFNQFLAEGRENGAESFSRLESGIVFAEKDLK